MRTGRPQRTLDKIAAVFWAQTTQCGACLEWAGNKYHGGYGRVSVKPRHYGEPIWQAHRLAWCLTNGPIPAGMQVCHTCDNPPCVTVGHLFLGTTQDNTADKVRKGRQLYGEKNPRAKLTEEHVREIRRRVAAGETRLALAAEYGVTPAITGAIAMRRIWRHVEDHL